MKLLPLDDVRWKNYRSGYNRVVLDTPSWLRELMSGNFTEQHWDYLWDELHHQGDVGEASYAVVPYLAEFATQSGRQDWHLWGFPVVVELARLEGNNPNIPSEINDSYYQAFISLSQCALSKESWEEEATGCMAACISLSKKQPIYARTYLELAGKQAALDYLKEETGWEP